MPPKRRRALLALLVAAWLGSALAADEQAQPVPPLLPLPGSCPDPRTTALVPEGCPCLPGSDSTGVCSSGFVCGQTWTAQVEDARQEQEEREREANARRLLGAGVPAEGSSAGALFPEAGQPSSDFVCQACAYGQLCPAGSSLPPVLDPAVQLAIDALACPAGFYCPTPSIRHRCPPGFFCPTSTIQPVTCNMSLLVSQAPLLPISFQPNSVAQRVFLYGDPLRGNSCPVNASNPTMRCPAGSFCPDPATIRECPPGFFCPEGSPQPQPCPFLTNCPQGAASADLSYTGFVILAVLLVLLWICYGVLRVVIAHTQRRQLRQQEAQDRLWRVLHPLFGPSTGGRSRQSFRALRAIRPRLTLEFKGLGLELRGGRTILSDVTGRFEHSRMTAVMGPSGAGKSTFLSVLLGKAGGMGRQQGVVLVNGREMRLAALTSITGFVPQDDVVHEDLTVRENLAYAARLRLSASKPAVEKLGVVEDALDLLQLRHVQHQVVGCVEKRGISGGQRKRTNIGLELVAKPSLLFMDEPTSGLDSTAAADILGALSRMARLGCNIVAVIHQPRFSIFRLFDDVLLLGGGGRMVFCGPSRLALPYFESLGFELPPNENPADFALDVISGSVSRQGGSAFQPAELPSLWLAHGRCWVQMQSKLNPKEDESLAVSAGQQQQQPGVGPEQLQLLEEQFDREDGDGDGALDAAGLLRLLEGLGLEPSTGSVAALMAELEVPRTGLLSKQAFIDFIKSGGRSPGAAPPTGTTADLKRRNETLYRVYSIEQYTLANALAELSAAALTPGMLASGASLRDIAAAHHKQQERAAAAAAAAGGSGEYGGGEGRSASTQSSSEEHRRMSSNASSVHTLDLAQHAQQARHDISPSPDQQKLLSLSGALTPSADAGVISTSTSARASFLLPAPQQPQQQQHAKQQEHPMIVDVPPPIVEAQGLLGWLGLSTGTPLRATPGTAAQFGLLLLRSGIKWTRNWPSKMLELLLLTLAAVVCGVMHGSGANEWQVRGNTAMAFLTLGVLSGATSLSVFGFGARMVWWREQERGVKSLAYFLAATWVQAIDVAVQPAVFLSIYASMTSPALPWHHLYGVGVLVTWYCMSLGALMSLVVPPSSSLMATVSLIMVAGGLLNGVQPNLRGMSPALRGLTSISYNRWAIEIVTIQSFASFPEWRWPSTKITMNHAGYCGLDGVTGFPDDAEVLSGLDTTRLLDIRVYCDNSVANAVLVLAALGTILRILTAMAVAYCPRGLQLGVAFERAAAAVVGWVKPARGGGRRGQLGQLGQRGQGEQA